MLILLIMRLCNSAPVYAQRYLTTFGLVSELKSAKNAVGIFSANINGDRVDDLVSYGGRQLHINIQRSTIHSWNTTSVYTDYPIARAVSGKCNPDKFDDIVLLTDSIQQLEVLLGGHREKFYLAWKSALEGVYDNLDCSDIDNDKRSDILLYGKKELGITVYAGRGNGSFQKKAVLLPEYSYSFLRVSDLNSDGINDILATNWISNSILVFTGFGQMKFSEPVEIPFSSEPSLVCTAFINGDQSVDIIAGLPDESAYCVLAGDGLGGFAKQQTMQLTGAPSNIEVEDINGDGHDDICVLSRDEASFRVDLSDGNGAMTEHAVFFAGSMPGDFVFVRQQNLHHAAILDHGANEIRLLLRSGTTTSFRPAYTYATGLQPYAVQVADINHDGWKDIITSNIKSKDISVLFNDSVRQFTGSVPFGRMDASGVLSYIPKNDTTAIFIGTNPESENISILELNHFDFSCKSLSLPTQGPAEILFAAMKPSSGHLHFTALERDKISANVSLVDYEQIASGRFVEKDVTPDITSAIVSAAIFDANNDKVPDIVFVSYDARRHQEGLYYALGDASKRFSEVTLISSFAAPGMVQAHVWTVDLNRDGRSDVVLNLRTPENRLTIFWGDEDSIISQTSLTIRQPIHIVRKEHLQVLDLNGDGALDLVCQNDIRKAIQLYQRRRNGTFLPPTRLAASEGLGTFVLADLDHDKIPELVMTDKIQGNVQIISLEER